MCNSDRQEIGHAMTSWILILLTHLISGYRTQAEFSLQNCTKTGYIAALGLLYLLFLKFSYWNIWLIFAKLSQGISYIQMSPKCDQTKAKCQHIC